jgi:hypothetical protein
MNRFEVSSARLPRTGSMGVVKSFIWNGIHTSLNPRAPYRTYDGCIEQLLGQRPPLLNRHGPSRQRA